VADLQGRRIGTSRGSIGQALVLSALRANTLPLDAVKFAYLLPAEAKSALVSGGIDAWATWGVFVAQARLVDQYRIQWKEEYDRDERAFCLEVLAPLLRRMGFLAIHYTQGAREYGKDFTFSELSPFGHLRHYGLQAKAGNVSGEVNSAIDELVGQADDAFRMPYYDIASTEPRFISTFVVAISGRFTANAKDKIVNKIPRGQHGSLLFLDRETVMELLNRYWSTMSCCRL
jgi:hypothetical protein